MPELVPVKVSQMDIASAMNDTDYLYLVHGSADAQITGATLANSIVGSSNIRAALAAAMTPSTSNAFVTAGRLPIDVRDYGSFSANSDVTATLQAAFDDLTTGQSLRIPIGEYLISSTLLFRNKSGVRIFGDGSANIYTTGTKLRWTGAVGGVLLDMSGAFKCEIDRLGFFANNSAAGTGTTQIAIQSQGNPTYNGSFFNTIHNCYLQNFGTGIVLGTSGGIDQVDSYTIEKNYFYYGVDGIGINNMSSNALVNQIINCTFITAGSPTTATGIRVERGGVKALNCISALNHMGIRIITPDGSSSIIGLHTERDDYGIYTDVTGTGNQKARTIYIADCYGYDPKTAFMYLANANCLYTLDSIFGTKVTGSDAILVPDNTDGVWINNMVTTDGVKRASDGVTVEPVYGYYGPQTIGRWQAHAPDTIYSGTLGPIITDRSDGHTYRIKSTAGVLGTELVT